MRLTKAELDAINTALSELLAGEGPQGVEDTDEGQAIMDAAHSAQGKIQTALRRKARDARPRAARQKTNNIYDFSMECDRCGIQAGYTNCPAEGADDLAVRDGWVKYASEEGYQRWVCPKHACQGCKMHPVIAMRDARLCADCMNRIAPDGEAR